MGKSSQRRIAAIAAAAAAVAFAWLTPGSTAEARPAPPTIVSPESGATVDDVVRFVAQSERIGVRAVLYVDGEARRVSKGRRVRWNFGDLDLGDLAAGRHRVAVTVTYRSGGRATARSTIVLRGSGDGVPSGAATPTPTPTPSSTTGSSPTRGTASGSAAGSTGSGSGSAAPPAVVPPTVKPPTVNPPTPTPTPPAVTPTPPAVTPPAVTPPASTPPASTPPPAAKAPTWGDGFESGDWRGWSFWGLGQAYMWGHLAVVDPRTEGVPVYEGVRVARFETTPDDIANRRWHAKLFQTFAEPGTGGSYATRRSPADVSGSYRVKYYFPTTYRVPDTLDNGRFVNIFQFKEKYLLGPRTAWTSDPQDPLWWIQLGDSEWAKKMGGPQGSRPDAPVAFINNNSNTWTRKMGWRVLPLGRWIEFRADIVQGQRIDFYIDGQLLDTGYQSEHPVSPFHANSIDWTFGIGNYSGSANGPVYADDASFTPRS